MSSELPLPADCREAFELAMGSEFASEVARERAVADAVETFREAIAREPEDARLWMFLGELELDRGAAKDARRAFRQVLRLDPDDALAHSGLAYACSQLGRLEEAEQLLAKAIVIDASDLLYAQLGSLLIDQGRVEEADRALRAGLELDPQNEEMLLLLARYCAKSDTEAKQLLERALEVEPEYFEAEMELGALFGSMEQLPEAAACFARAIGLEPDLPDGYRELAAVRLPDEPDRAVELLDRALQIDSNDARAWSLLGEAHLRRGQSEPAERALLKGCAIRPLDPDVARAHWVLSKFLEEKDRVSEAIVALRTAVPMAHAWPPLAADLGRLLIEQGQIEEARDYLHLALEHDIEDELSRELLRGLQG